MEILQPKMDILPLAQQELWASFKDSIEQGFVLYGGTAIALQLGHRESVDFDFFTEKSFNNDKLRKQPFLKNYKTIHEDINTLSGYLPTANGNVNISYFGGIDTGRLAEPLITEDGVMQIAHLDDLLSTKLKTVMQRIEYKDYADIYHMLKHGLSLEKGLLGAMSLYGNTFSPMWCLRTLEYFEEPNLQKMSNEMKDFLIAQVAQVNLERLASLPIPQKINQLSIDVKPPEPEMVM